MSFSSRHLRTAQVWSSLQIEQRTTTELCCGILRHWLDHRFQKTFNQVTSSSSHHQHVTPTQSLLSRSHNVTKGSQEVWLLWFNLSSPPLYFLLSVFLNFGLMNNFFFNLSRNLFHSRKTVQDFHPGNRWSCRETKSEHQVILFLPQPNQTVSVSHH